MVVSVDRPIVGLDVVMSSVLARLAFLWVNTTPSRSVALRLPMSTLVRETCLTPSPPLSVPCSPRPPFPLRALVDLLSLYPGV